MMNPWKWSKNGPKRTKKGQKRPKFGQNTLCVSVLPTIVRKMPTIGGNGFRGPYSGQNNLILAFFLHFRPLQDLSGPNHCYKAINLPQNKLSEKWKKLPKRSFKVRGFTAELVQLWLKVTLCLGLLLKEGYVEVRSSQVKSNHVSSTFVSCGHTRSGQVR